MTINRIAPAQRPSGSALGFQSWRNLTFIHWRIPSELISPMLPGGVNVDTFEGSAWLGLVPFEMRGVRPWWSPAVPGLSNFLETNLRTYVVVNGEPGVWFFSLDAAQSLAVKIARWKWSLPYFHAEMSFQHDGSLLEYSGRRLGPNSLPADYKIRLRRQSAETDTAKEGTLDHFLVERYLLFAVNRRQQLLRGQVHHQPYQLHAAELIELRESIRAAAGLETPADVAHVRYSRGVDVEIFPLRPVAISDLPTSTIVKAY